MKKKRMLLVVGFLVIAILVYVKFESIIKANTEEKKTEMVAETKTTKELSPEAPDPGKEPGWQQYTKNDPLGIFIGTDKKMELRYKFGSSEEEDAEQPFVTGTLQGGGDGFNSGFAKLVPNVYLHDYTQIDVAPPNNPPQMLEAGDINALERGDQPGGPNTSAPILLGYVTDTGEAKTVFRNDKYLSYSSIRLYRKTETDQTTTTMLKYNWSMQQGFLAGYLFEVTQVLKPYKGTIRVESYLKNITSAAANKPELKNITLNSHYPIGLGYTAVGRDKNPIFYIGNNRGLYMQYTSHLHLTYRLNYFFNVPNPVTNWMGAMTLPGIWSFENGTASNEEQSKAETAGFFNKKYIFDGITGAGNEQDNGIAGTNVPEPPYWSQIHSKDPAFSMKSDVKESFGSGDTISYAYNIGLQKIDEVPAIVLDETEDFRVKGQNTYSIKGQWFDNDSTEIDLFYSIDDGTVKGPYRQKTSTEMLGQGIDFSIDLTEPGDLKPQDHKIEIYAKDIPELNSGLEAQESNHETFELVYVDDDPKIELDETIGAILPGGYKVKGRYTGNDEKYKPATISYKKVTDPDSKYKEMTLVNSPDQTFEFTIPEKDMPDANGTYVFSIRAENKYGVLSNVEDVMLSNKQTKPKFALADKSKDNLLSQTAKEYPIDFTSFTHTGLFYPLTVQYKVDDEKEWQQMTDQPVGTMTPVLTEVTEGPKTINLPASKLSFGENHVVHFVVSDRFGILSDEQSVAFNMPGKPEIASLEKEQDFSMGVDYTVAGTVSLTDAYFPFTFYYKIGTGAYKEVTMAEEPNETSGKFSFIIPKEELPRGVKHVIEIKARDRFAQESNSAILTLEGIRKSDVIVKFIDDAEPPQSIAKDITFTQEIGTSIDLGKAQSVRDVIDELKTKYEQILPDPTRVVEFTDDSTTIEYKFKGRLTYLSFPEAFDFKLNVASYKKIRIDDPTAIGMPLVVSDTRASSPGWSLKVKLTEELLNEDGHTTLRNAVRYKSGKTETILNNQAFKIVQNLKSGEYNVSKDWNAEGDGFKLEIAPGAVNALGKYHGEILIELGETP